jgi:hypothetical protein
MLGSPYTSPFMPWNAHRYLHRDFVLSCTPKQTEDGRFQVTVAVTYLGGERTRSQRFIDIAEKFATVEEAAANARAVGIEWIDQQLGGG